jgi:hypothetical protein
VAKQKIRQLPIWLWLQTAGKSKLVPQPEATVLQNTISCCASSKNLAQPPDTRRYSSAKPNNSVNTQKYDRIDV